MRKMIKESGKKRLKISLYGRNLNSYLIFCNEKERAWVTFDLKKLRLDKLKKGEWTPLHELEIADCRREDNGHLHYLILGDRDAIQLLNSLED